MRIKEMPAFRENFRKLSPSEKASVLSTIELFSENPRDASLKNHRLTKPMLGLSSISVTSDIRIIFREKGEYEEVLFMDIGSHQKVYKK